MHQDRETLRVVVFQEGDTWVAQCLDYDIGAQAPSLTELQVRFALTVEAECQESIDRNGEPFAGISPAPKHFQEMWDKRAGNYQPANLPSQNGPRYEMALCA